MARDDDAVLNGCAALLAGTGCLLLLLPTIVIGIAVVILFVYAFWPW